MACGPCFQKVDGGRDTIQSSRANRCQEGTKPVGLFLAQHSQMICLCLFLFSVKMGKKKKKKREEEKEEEEEEEKTQSRK